VHTQLLIDSIVRQTTVLIAQLATSGGVRPRGVCTRTCNFGCPNGSQCVARIPSSNGTMIGGLCMQPCAEQADCETELGSECAMPGTLERSYCF
jgi:hypothetical protein